MATGSDFAEDRPLTDEASDRLNRAQFSRRVASMLRELPNGSSIVVGIDGPWGDGKTTVLNFIKAELGRSPGISTVDFNPWRFSEEASMLLGFFEMLSRTIRVTLRTGAEKAASMCESLARLVVVTAPKGVFGKLIEFAGNRIGKLLGRLSTVTLEEMHGRLGKALSDAGQRIVVFVDDIDRLEKHEVHTLFRLMKTCADFPNICYVLAFDYEEVAKALGERYGGGDNASGRAFLEKIVQIPLKLPIASTADLRALCFDEVNQALEASGIELTKAEGGEFVSGFDRCIGLRLTTPRATKRFRNALMFVLPMLKGEVSMADLLLIEALRAFFPNVHAVVRDHQDQFAGVERPVHGEKQKEPGFVRLLKPVLSELSSEEADAVKDLLVDLFPRLGGYYRNRHFQAEWIDEWSRERRVCSPNHCGRYFSFTVSRDDVSDAAVEEMLEVSKSGNESETVDRLGSLLLPVTARKVIEKLRSREAMFDETSAERLAVSVAKLGDRFPAVPGMFTFGEPPSQAAILISHLLRRLKKGEKRLQVAMRVAEVAEPLWFAAECVRWMRVTDKEENDASNALTREEVLLVGKVLVGRIKSQVGSGSPIVGGAPNWEVRLLFVWAEVEGREPVDAYLQKLLAEDPTQVGRFLSALAPQSWGDRSGPKVGSFRSSQLEDFATIIDPDALARLIERRYPSAATAAEESDDDTTPVDERLAASFLLTYKAWKTHRQRAQDATRDVVDHDP